MKAKVSYFHSKTGYVRETYGGTKYLRWEVNGEVGDDMRTTENDTVGLEFRSAV